MLSDGADVMAIVRALWLQWPQIASLGPRDLGPHASLEALQFLRAVQAMCDEGLLSYEALIIDATGPRIISASLTSRGRSTYSAQIANRIWRTR
jgi:hypothetical protein